MWGGSSLPNKSEKGNRTSMGVLGDLRTLRIAPVGEAMARILHSFSMGWRYKAILRDLAVSFGTCQPWQRKTRKAAREDGRNG